MVASSDEIRWTKRLTEWQPKTGKRRGGRNVDGWDNLTTF